MSKADKLLDRMSHNPAGDWTIADVQTVCKGLGWTCLPPMGGGSHWKVAAPRQEMILTIPAKRPIKPVYIRKLLQMVKASNHGQDDD